MMANHVFNKFVLRINRENCDANNIVVEVE